MAGPNTVNKAVLLARVETDGTPDESPARTSPVQREAQLSFLEAALVEGGLCRGVRISNNELIGLFPTAEAAILGACAMQQAWAEHHSGSTAATVRILLDNCPAPHSQEQDPIPPGWSGTATRRLLQEVPPGQVFATRAIGNQLGELAHARFRLHEQEGAERSDSPLYQVICSEETITRVAIPTQYKEPVETPFKLNLRWRDNNMTLEPESPSLTIGRGEQSDIQIDSDLASRNHARLGFQQTNFMLADQSTNGTFVQIDNGEEVFVHHEQIVLRGRGVISLGRHVRGGGGKLIYFKMTT